MVNSPLITPYFLAGWHWGGSGPLGSHDFGWFGIRKRPSKTTTEKMFKCLRLVVLLSYEKAYDKEFQQHSPPRIYCGSRLSNVSIHSLISSVIRFYLWIAYTIQYLAGHLNQKMGGEFRKSVLPKMPGEFLTKNLPWQKFIQRPRP